MKRKAIMWLLTAALLMGHATYVPAAEETDLLPAEETVLSEETAPEDDAVPPADEADEAATEAFDVPGSQSASTGQDEPLIIDEEAAASDEIPAAPSPEDAAQTVETPAAPEAGSSETEDIQVPGSETEALEGERPETESPETVSSETEDIVDSGTDEPAEPVSEEETETETEDALLSEDAEDGELLAEELEETAEESSQELEAANTITTATPITLGVNYAGTISEDKTNTIDYYKFVLPSSGRITFSATAYMKYINYYLYDASESKIWSKNAYWNSTTEISTVSATYDLTKGTYYVVVKKDGKNYGNYNFSVTFESALESFTETGSGVNNSITAAASIAIGTTYKGQIAQNDTKDFYKFTLGTSGQLTIDATAYLRYIHYYLYDSTGKQIWSANPGWDSTTQRSVKSYVHHLTSGTYYLACTRDGYTGTYSFKLSFITAGETFKEVQNGSNNSTGAANSISFNTLYRGQLALNDTKDFYRFSLTSGTTITLNASAVGMHWIYYSIYNQAGVQQWKKNPSWNSTLGTIESSYDIVLTAGTYYLAVEKDGSYGNYSFTLTKQDMNTPKLLATYNGAWGIGIKWQIEPYADSYEIWRKYQGAWSRIATVSASDSSLEHKANTLMYTDTSVKTKYGYGYIYSVAAKRGSVTTAYNKTGLAAYRLAPPALTGGTNSAAGKALIKWKSTPCHGYQLQYCISSNTSKWTSLPVTSSLSKTVSGLKKGKKYYFRIRCYKTNKDRGTTWSEYSPWVSVVIKK